MHIFRAFDHKVMPWKNGGGTTTEIAVSPAGAGLDDFDWRVSMARVEADGPFSAFPGVDRTLAVLEGQGIALDIEGHDIVMLTQSSGPYSFPADEATYGRPIHGPITDLNVMVRRGRCAAGVMPLVLNSSLDLQPEAPTLVFIKVGTVLLESGETLAAHDCLQLDAGERATLHPGSSTVIYLIELSLH